MATEEKLRTAALSKSTYLFNLHFYNSVTDFRCRTF